MALAGSCGTPACVPNARPYALVIDRQAGFVVLAAAAAAHEGEAGAASTSGTRSQSVMCFLRTRNAVRAVPPVPPPHSPFPGRSVSLNVTMKKPCGAGFAAITFAPQGSVRLKKRTSARVVSLIGVVPLATRLGSAK